MSRFVSVSGAAWGHGIPISTDGSQAPQQRWAPDQRNPRQQRCFLSRVLGCCIVSIRPQRKLGHCGPCGSHDGKDVGRSRSWVDADGAKPGWRDFGSEVRGHKPSLRRAPRHSRPPHCHCLVWNGWRHCRIQGSCSPQPRGPRAVSSGCASRGNPVFKGAPRFAGVTDPDQTGCRSG